MSNIIKISVIITTYKRPTMLSRAVNSVLNQTYSNIEVIVVDDNDEDSIYRKQTESIMSEYDDNNNVIYVKHKKNMNGAAARNTGIKYSNGDIICFLDDDDYFLETKVEKQVKYLTENQNKFSAVYCGRKKGNEEIIYDYEGDLTKEILCLDFSPTSSTLMFYKSSLIDINGFDESYKRHQDFEMLIRFLKKYKIGAVKEILTITGINEGENQLVGKDLEQMKINFLMQFNKELNELEKSFKGVKKEVYIKHYISILISYIKQKDIINIARVYISCFIKYPIIFNKLLYIRLTKYI